MFAHKTDIRVVSLEAPYAVDVVLPIEGITNVVTVDVDTVQRKLIILPFQDRIMFVMINL